VLLDAEPITVHRMDHFRAAFTTLTCSASPIFGLHGELLGVLDASAVRSPDERESQRLVNHIVRQSALLIEDAYFLNAATDCWVLLAHRNRHYVEAQPEILIGVDACGNAIAANRRARSGEIQQLKNDRVIGEDRDGYLAMRRNPDDPKYLAYAEGVVKDENADRSFLYLANAQAQSKPLEIIERDYAQLWSDRAWPGEWVQKEDGNWIQK